MLKVGSSKFYDTFFLLQNHKEGEKIIKNENEKNGQIMKFSSDHSY